MIAALVRWLTGGVLDRALQTVDRKIAADVDREKLKADLIVVSIFGVIGIDRLRK